ncbi:SLBB domain-containing protein, partial [Candidatus Poribacteria bacterium]|nr:SLBB domain-containing protein [Candidatus Poribacteria bacterium]
VRASGEKIEVKVSEQFWRDVQDGNDTYYLYDGDVLYLPDAYRIEKVYVLGYVQNPGPQKVRGAVTPMQVIALAGGTKEEANLKKARIMRKDGTIQGVRLRQYNNRRTNEAEVLLYGGDTLEISKRFQVNWSLILSLISVTSVAVGIIMRR